MISRIVLLCGLALLAGCSNRASGPAAGTAVAEEALRAGAPAIALQVTKAILERTPDDVPALEIHGEASAQVGNPDEAAADFTKALRLKADSTRAQLGLGRLRLTTDPKESATLFEAVVKREPHNLNALNNLGIARDLLGDHQGAQDVYRQALAVDPSNAPAAVNLALSLAMSGRASEGVPLIQPLATDAAATPRMRHDYAVVLAMAGREDEAGQILAQDLPPDQVKRALETIRQQRGGR